MWLIGQQKWAERSVLVRKGQVEGHLTNPVFLSRVKKRSQEIRQLSGM